MPLPLPSLLACLRNCVVAGDGHHANIYRLALIKALGPDPGSREAVERLYASSEFTLASVTEIEDLLGLREAVRAVLETPDFLVAFEAAHRLLASVRDVPAHVRPFAVQARTALVKAVTGVLLDE